MMVVLLFHHVLSYILSVTFYLIIYRIRMVFAVMNKILSSTTTCKNYNIVFVVVRVVGRGQTEELI